MQARNMNGLCVLSWVSWVFGVLGGSALEQNATDYRDSLMLRSRCVTVLARYSDLLLPVSRTSRNQSSHPPIEHHYRLKDSRRETYKQQTKKKKTKRIKTNCRLRGVQSGAAFFCPQPLEEM